MEPTNRRRIVRALEVTLGSGRPFSSYGPGLDAHPPTAVHAWSASGVTRDDLARPDRRAATTQQMEAGFLDEVRRLPRRPARPVAHRRARPSATRSCSPTSTATCTLDEALDLAVRRTRRFARRQRAWFRRDPRITWLDVGAGRATGTSSWTLWRRP